VIWNDQEKKPSKERDGASEAARNATEQAGVDRVVEFEMEAGREPTVMPCNHPGYDIESCNAAGDVERYIEVKSLSGRWDRQGVGLTRTEFERANAFRDAYWLYVVERAQQKDSEIHRIQNPGARVTQFFYDRGWELLSEAGDKT
jgi:hypothetical protein